MTPPVKTPAVRPFHTGSNVQVRQPQDTHIKAKPPTGQHIDANTTLYHALRYPSHNKLTSGSPVKRAGSSFLMLLPPAPAADSTPPLAADPAAIITFLGEALPLPLSLPPRRWWCFTEVEFIIDSAAGDIGGGGPVVAAVGVGVPLKAKKDVAGPVEAVVMLDGGVDLGKAAPGRREMFFFVVGGR